MVIESSVSKLITNLVYRWGKKINLCFLVLKIKISLTYKRELIIYIVIESGITKLIINSFIGEARKFLVIIVCSVDIIYRYVKYTF